MSDEQNSVTPEDLAVAAKTVDHRRVSMGSDNWCLESCPACNLNKAADALRAEQEKRERAEADYAHLQAASRSGAESAKRRLERAEAAEAENRRQAQEIERLRDALRRYGTHDPTCSFGQGHFNAATGEHVEYGCSCGIRAALSTTDTAQQVREG